jgi:hypothetical protein
LNPTQGYITRISGQLKKELRESLETAVEDDRGEMAKIGIRLCCSYSETDTYNYCVEIRCQNTTSED